MRKTSLLCWLCCWLLGAALLALGPYLSSVSAVAQVNGQTQNNGDQVDKGVLKRPLVRVLPVEGVINPASADFVVRGIEQAIKDNAHLVILRMDTPGGLDASMRTIIRSILSSSIPVATFVAPSGARAASAGAFILYASHIAAMTPASNLGAASPISVGGGGASPESDPRSRPADRFSKGPATDSKDQTDKNGVEKSDENGRAAWQSGMDTSMRKATNDAAAYLRSLAQLRGRNVEFAESAVFEAQSLSAQDALDKNVIDFVATDIPQLLRQLDNKEVALNADTRVTLHTAHADIEEVAPGWRTEVLAIIANPQVALILMMVGVYGLFFELTNPGTAIPGVAGLICLVLGLYAFQLLPVNWAGLALMFLGMAMMVAEVFLPSFGALGVGGIVAFVIGGMMSTDVAWPGYSISMSFLIGVALCMAALIILTGTLATRAYKRPVVTGKRGMIGMQGRVAFLHEGATYAEVGGERWRITSSHPLELGQAIRVTGVEGLTLIVEPETTSDSQKL